MIFSDFFQKFQLINFWYSKEYVAICIAQWHMHKMFNGVLLAAVMTKNEGIDMEAGWTLAAGAICIAHEMVLN